MFDYELERLMNTYGDYIARICYIYLKNKTLAEDATQEVFINAYIWMNDFRQECSEKTWLTSIAINVCKGYLRANWQRRVQIGIERMQGYDTTEGDLEIRIANTEILKKVMNLKIKYREIILLYYYQDLKVNEIADMLKISESSVKMRLKRARTKLKEDFEKEEYIYG